MVLNKKEKLPNFSKANYQIETTTEEKNYKEIDRLATKSKNLKIK